MQYNSRKGSVLIDSLAVITLVVAGAHLYISSQVHKPSYTNSIQQDAQDAKNAQIEIDRLRQRTSALSLENKTESSE